MAEKNNSTCSICGKKYYVCLSCRDSIKVNPWKIHTDTAEHYKVYQVIHGYSTGVYNKEEAKTKFKNINLSDLNSFRPHIKTLIKSILKEEKNVVKPVEKMIEDKVEKPIENSNEVETEVVATENKNSVVENVEKATVSRKRNFKVETE